MEMLYEDWGLLPAIYALTFRVTATIEILIVKYGLSYCTPEAMMFKCPLSWYA
jgi:hypothetical protein